MGLSSTHTVKWSSDTHKINEDNIHVLVRKVAHDLAFGLKNKKDQFEP